MTTKEEKIEILRDTGFLDKLLSQLRCKKANSLIKPELRKGKILDIGCGTYPLFLLNTPFDKKYGLDQVVENDSHQRWEKENIFFKRYNLEKDVEMPFEDNYFDVVTMLAVFEHIEPEMLIKQLEEIRRILKPSGTFIMTTPAAWTDALLRVMAKFRLVSPVEFAEHKDAYTPCKITRLYEKAGFTRKNMRIGYFEVFLNIWVAAQKEMN